jgi:type I restriction enzyme S subunit
MSEPRWDVPSSWAWSSAGGIARIIGGGTPSSKNEDNFAPHGIPWITPADLTGYEDAYISRGRRDLSDTGYRTSGAQLLPAGTVLYSSRAPIGYCAIAQNEISTNQGFKSLVLEGGILPEFIRYYLIASKAYAESLATGTTFLELSGARVSELSIPVAPLPEQRRIVGKLDALLAGVARARKELDRVPILIAHHKQALLAAAFSGELTRKWREERGCSLDSWSTTTLGELVDDGPSNGWSPPSSGSSKGALSLKLTATTSGKLRLDENAVKRIDETPLPDSKFWLKPGDVLIQRANSLEHVGACAIFDGPENTYIYPDLMMRVRLRDPVKRRYVWRVLNSEKARAYFRANATGSAGNMPKINGGTVRALQIPLPPPDELTAIVTALDSAFEWLEGSADEHARAARLLPKLEQAILAKAFRGELVPQDPADEPAAVLLERIKSQRAVNMQVHRQIVRRRAGGA